MTDHPELLESLSRAVSAVIALAKDKGIFPSLPTEKYELHWMEPTDDARSTGKHEEREEHSYSILTQQIGVRWYRFFRQLAKREFRS